MNNLINLTDEQKRAINSNNNVVITACPGSGKTTIMVGKICNEIPQLKSYQGIIAITFTVKSSREMKQRVNENTHSLKSSFFGTIDHFCLSEIIYPFADRVFGQPIKKVECKRFKDIDALDKQSLPREDEIVSSFLTKNYSNFHHKFKSHYLNGFILLEAVGIIANHILITSQACRRYIKARYTSLYVDEYQDSSEPQHQLVLNLLELGLKTTVVGDERQSIYAWRGSSPEYLRSLIDLRDDFDHHIVNINHRCHPSIINYANRLYSKNCQLLPTDELRVFRLCLEGTQLDLCEQLNTIIPFLRQKFNVVKYSDIAILVRNNRSLDYLTRKLTLPFRVYKDDSLSIIHSSHTKLYSNLLSYYFNEKYLLNDISQLLDFKSKVCTSEFKLAKDLIQSLRTKNESDLICSIKEISSVLLGNEGNEIELKALTETITNENELKSYKTTNSNELQVMTLHKSKSLEFEVVIHLDMYEWVFPRREYTGDWNNISYPSWEQDLNLHHVGVTRAKQACILAYSTRRINSSNENRFGQPSAFFNIEGLVGLYTGNYM